MKHTKQFNGIAMLAACAVLALPMAAAAKHKESCYQLRVTVTPKPGYTCHTKKRGWLYIHGVNWWLHRYQRATLKPGAIKGYTFEMMRARDGGAVDMSFVCHPVGHTNLEKKVKITSSLTVNAVHPANIPSITDGYRAVVAGLAKPADRATVISTDTKTNDLGYCKGRSTIRWMLG